MAPSGQLTAPALQELLVNATLAGDWTLDEANSTIGLRSRSIWGLGSVEGPVSGERGVGQQFLQRSCGQLS